MDDPDIASIGRLTRGDTAALAAVFDRHAPTLTRYAWALAGSRQDVEELVQDTFTTLWQKATTGQLRLPDGISLLPWLLTVCKNHARNQARRNARDHAVELPEWLTAPDTTDAADQLRYVRAEIAALPDTDRRLAELCLLQGHSYAEAAAELGLTVGAVTKRVSRTRSRLKKAVMHDEH